MVFFNGGTTKYLVFQCMCITSISNNRDYVCAEDENEALRLYILVPGAKPWGLTNQPGFLVSSDPKWLRVTCLHLGDGKRQKWKVLHFARKEVFSSNSNIGTEIKIDGVLGATETHFINKMNNCLQFYVLRKAMTNICSSGIICVVKGRQIKQFFSLLWMGNWGIEIWFTWDMIYLRSLFFSLTHTQMQTETLKENEMFLNAWLLCKSSFFYICSKFLNCTSPQIPISIKMPSTWLLLIESAKSVQSFNLPAVMSTYSISLHLHPHLFGCFSLSLLAFFFWKKLLLEILSLYNEGVKGYPAYKLNETI